MTPLGWIFLLASTAFVWGLTGWCYYKVMTIPGGLVRRSGEVLARLGVRTPGAKHLPINRLTHLALHENPYPSQRIRTELGWSPPYDHRSALERTGRWLAHRGRRSLAR